MQIRFEILTLQFRESREILDLSSQFSYFHGPISAGKSSIVRIINFCLGGDLQKTTAIKKELICATLTAQIGVYKVIFDRELHSNSIKVTWSDKEGYAATVSAPTQAGDSPIWLDQIFNITDLLYHFLDVTPLKVKRSKSQEDSPLVRLSFRDIMWYCYLDQDHMDSSFFRLEDPNRAPKSRDVMRLIVGYHSEKLSQLEVELKATRDDRLSKANTAEELRKLLLRFGYGTEQEIQEGIDRNKAELEEARAAKSRIEAGYSSETHTADNLRQNLRKAFKRIGNIETAILDLQEKIDDQVSLRAELLSSKFKLARAQSVANVFANVSFDMCPSCGKKVKKPKDPDHCNLCGEKTNEGQEPNLPQAESLRLDIDMRIDELESSINEHKKALERQKRLLEKLKNQKRNMDERLRQELSTYESKFLSQSNEITRQIATYTERIRNDERVKKMPEEIETLLKASDELLAKEQGMRRKIEEERSKLGRAIDLIEEIENTFLEVLLKVGFPGVTEEDTVHINKRTWEVHVWPEDQEYLQYNLFGAGSGGKKTLYNVCYALAVHMVAESNQLPLPRFLMIDSPMKNIGEDVNRELFDNFYRYLYDLSTSTLAEHQFIIVEKHYVSPKEDQKPKISVRHMTPDDPENPPLIPYYRGA